MIVIRTDEEITQISKAGKIVALVLKSIKKKVAVGVSTKELEDFSVELIHKHGAVSAFKGYEGYPSEICTSVNEEIVHASPSSRVLKEGDIVSIDVGVKYEGYFADAAVTFAVGKITGEVERLLKVTEKALVLAISQTKPGNFLSDISHTIESFVSANGFSVVKEFVGHGIGTRLHEDPQIPNFGPPHQGPELKAGMVLAIEPMVNIGKSGVEILNDGWTAVTKDRLASAHFEHTIAITQNGNRILTK